MGAPKVIPTVTVTLTGEPAVRLQELVDSGRYETAEIAVISALDDLPIDDDPELEAWLRIEVVPAYDESIADPESFVGVAEARAEIFGER